MTAHARTGRSALDRLAALSTGRRSSWAALAVSILLGVLVIGAGSALSDAGGAPTTLPESAESATVMELQQQFPEAGVNPAIAVFTAGGEELSREDMATIQDMAERFAEVVGAQTSPPVPSPDGQAAIVNIPVVTGDGGQEGDQAIEELRRVIDEELTGDLTAQLTGGSAFAADTSAAFDGANLRLLLITAAVVAALLLITYRSPVLWLVPLIVVALADRISATLVDAVGEVADITVDGSTAGIVSVLVFGAGTNYALLLVSRYREELRRHPDHRDALNRALRAAAPAILASNATVVLALLTLLAGVLPNNRSLGVSATVGLLVALVFALTMLPAALAVCGRGLFWPFIPRVGQEGRERSGAWFRVASTVSRRPVVVVVGAFAVLVVLASGLLGTRVGLSQTEQFRVSSESVEGYETLAEHFPAGASDPVAVITRTDQADQVLEVTRGVDGVSRADVSSESDTGLTQINAVLEEAPGTEDSYQVIADLREDVHAVEGAEALVGGSVARALDTRDGMYRDLRVIVPLVLLVVLAVLVPLLRSVVAPLVLVGINIVSSLAALGAGSWVSRTVFDFPALDTSAPLFAFLFLVALGIDYTVFLVIRAREEAGDVGTRRGIVEAVGLTGGVITSAGIVLAAVFVVLGVLPLITLTQIGIIVGLGILLDTFLVRTVIVPAVFMLIGKRIWWPSALSHGRD